MRSLLLLVAVLSLAPDAFARSRSVGHRTLPWHAPQCTEVSELGWFRFVDAGGEVRKGVDPVLVWREPVLTTEALELGAGPNVLWVTTSDGAIRQSMDAGCTWSVKATVPEILADLFEPRILARHAEHVYVYTVPHISSFAPVDSYLQSDQAMLIRLSYNAVATFPFPEHVLDLAVDPTNSLRLLAVGFTGALYDSSDGGASWQQRATGSFGPLNTARIDPSNLNRIAVAPRSGGLRLTTNGGGTISEPPAQLATTIVSDIFFSPADPNVIWTDGYDQVKHDSGLQRSNDGGRTFVLELTNATAVYVTGGIFAAHPRDANTYAIPVMNAPGLLVVDRGVQTKFGYDQVKKVLWSPSGTLYYLVQVITSR